MHVVLIAAGSRGDVQPMFALARLAIAAGHRATVCAPANFESMARDHSVDFRPAGDDFERVLSRQGAAATGGFVASIRGFNGLLESQIAGQFASFPDALRGADLIIGGGLPAAAPSIAEAMNVDYFQLVYCPTMLRSAAHPPIVVPWQNLPKWANRAAWAVADKVYGHVMLQPINRHRSRIGLAPIADVYAYLIGRRAILAADPALAPVPADVRIPFVRAGFLALEDPSELDPELEAFLAAGSPPVYFGFGSMPDVDPVKTTTMMVNAGRKAGHRVLISSGWARLGATFHDDDDVRVIGPTPHAKLFPRLACVVHHGGAGTTSTAARAGVPQILVPHLFDQGYWAHRVSTLGIGPRSIARSALSAQRLTDAIEQARTRSITRNARDFASRMTAPLEFARLHATLMD